MTPQSIWASLRQADGKFVTLVAFGLLVLLGMSFAYLAGELPALLSIFGQKAAGLLYCLSVLAVVLAARVTPRPAPLIGLFLFGVILFWIWSSQLWGFLTSAWIPAALIWVENLVGTPAFRQGLQEFEGLPYLPQILLLWGSALCYLLMGKLLEGRFGGKNSSAENRQTLSDLLQKDAVRLLVFLLMVVTVGFYLLPDLARWHIKPGTINIARYMEAHASFPALALIVLFAGALPPARRPEVKPVATAVADPAKDPRAAPDLLQLLQDLLKSAGKIGAIEFSRREKSTQWFNPFKSASPAAAPESTGLLAQKIEKACKRAGIAPDSLAVDPMLQALDVYESARRKPESPLSDNNGHGVILLEDTLLDYKLILIAAALAHHLARGRNVILMADNRRILDLKSNLAKALRDFLPDSAYIWLDADDSAASARPTPAILYGDCAAIMGRARHLLDGAPTAARNEFHKNNRAFFLHLGIVTVLDAHFLDFLELARLLRILSEAQNGMESHCAQLMLQCEPVENASEAVGNALIGHPLGNKMRLARTPGDGQLAFVWNTGGQGKSTFDEVAQAMKRRARVVHLIDEVHDEDHVAWNALGTKLEEQGERHLDVQIDVLGRYEGQRDACFIDRDRGNLAAAILRDVGAPGDGTGLLVILSDPLPMQETLKKGIWQAKDKRERVEYSRLQTDLGAYLPRLPNASGGVQEMLRDIALLFLVRQTAVPTAEVAAIVKRHMKGRLNGLDLEKLGIDDVSRVLSAKGLNALFGRMSRRNAVGLFSQTDALRSSSEKDELTCGSLLTLSTLAFGETYAGAMRIALPMVDRGLIYDEGSTFVSRGQLYRINRFNADGSLETRVATASTGLEARRQELFGKTYNLSAAAPGKHSIRQGMATVFALVDYERKTKVKTARRLNNPTVLDPVAHTNIVWKGSLAEAVFLRIACRETDETKLELVAAGLCLSLQDVIDLKFPAVAHRISVVSPQLKHQHSLDTSLDSVRLALVEESEPVFDLLRQVANKSISGASPDARAYVELMVLEDSDTTLGVVDALESAFDRMGQTDEDTLTKVWREHLAVLAEGKAGASPFADWGGANAALKLGGAG